MENYKTISLFLYPIESEVSQYRIKTTCDQMADEGYKFLSMKIIDECNIMLMFSKS